MEHERVGARVLVADDSGFAAAVLGDALRHDGHVVTHVRDGAAALAALRGGLAAEILITDGEMPVMGGRELCRAIRADEALCALPVVYLTADEGQVVAALDAGADDYLAKPFGAEELRARVRAALRMGRMRAEMREQRDMSLTLIESLQDGLMVVDGTGRILSVNDRLAAITGLARDALVGADPPYAFWPVELAAHYSDRLRRALAGRGAGEADRTYLHPDGAPRTVIVNIAPLPSEQPLFVSTVKDVTARRAAELEARALAREQGALSRVAAAVAAAEPPEAVFALVAREVAEVFEVDAAGVARFTGGHAELVGSWASDEAMRLPVGATLPLVGDSLTARVWRDGLPVRAELGSAAWDADGHVSRRSAVAAPVTVDGARWGTVGALSADPLGLPEGSEVRVGKFATLVGLAIASAESRAEMERMASTDALTGLANRRAFEARLAGEVGRAAAAGHPLSLVMVDMDHFKRVNDEYGHEAGDATLRELAARLRGGLRDGDMVARVGGEEFVCILPGAGLDAALRRAELLRARVSATPFPGVGPQTLSAGVAELLPGESGEALLRAADARLYAAKEAGRDRVMGTAADRRAGAPG